MLGSVSESLDIVNIAVSHVELSGAIMYNRGYDTIQSNILCIILRRS